MLALLGGSGWCSRRKAGLSDLLFLGPDVDHQQRVHGDQGSTSSGVVQAAARDQETDNTQNQNTAGS